MCLWPAVAVFVIYTISARAQGGKRKKKQQEITMVDGPFYILVYRYIVSYEQNTDADLIKTPHCPAFINPLPHRLECVYYTHYKAVNRNIKKPSTA